MGYYIESFAEPALEDKELCNLAVALDKAKKNNLNKEERKQTKDRIVDVFQMERLVVSSALAADLVDESLSIFHLPKFKGKARKQFTERMHTKDLIATNRKVWHADIWKSYGHANELILPGNTNLGTINYLNRSYLLRQSQDEGLRGLLKSRFSSIKNFLSKRIAVVVQW